MKKTIANELNFALDRLLSSNKCVHILGEDISDPYGGAFKVTKGLSTKYPSQVHCTPISEAAIVGIASGLAMRGMIPIVEIMFGDFITLSMDQIVNHISKYKWMYNNQVEFSLVIRTPMGGGRGYGPTHSQSLEKLFLGVPFLKIVALSYYHNVGELLESAAAKDKGPVLFIENKSLYSEELREGKNGFVDEFSIRRYTDKDLYPTILLSTNNFKDPDVTVLTYGGMVTLAEQAALEVLIEEEIFVEIVVPSLIKPFDADVLEESLLKTGRLIIVEEGTITGGWGAEVASVVQEKYFGCLKSPVLRIASKDLPIPSAKYLENLVLPSKEDVKNKIKRIYRC
ncbi:MAG: transketolase C-terminal domain-containing protein [Sedimentisphaerales bacterium]|jgi:pyruvate/2-oxoglutarate/acetoin dehydrogenase E1 component